MTIDPHFREHDPILDANHCERCNAALRHTLILLADMDLGPKDAGMLAKRIREIALGLEPPPPQYVVDVTRPGAGSTEYRDSVLFQDRDEQADLVDAEIDIPLPKRSRWYHQQ
jgi:hypothetical protein